MDHELHFRAHRRGIDVENRQIGTQPVTFRHRTRMLDAFPSQHGEQIGQRSRYLSEGDAECMAAVNQALIQIGSAGIGVHHGHIERQAYELRRRCDGIAGFDAPVHAGMKIGSFEPRPPGRHLPGFPRRRQRGAHPFCDLIGAYDIQIIVILGVGLWITAGDHRAPPETQHLLRVLVPGDHLEHYQARGRAPGLRTILAQTDHPCPGG